MFDYRALLEIQLSVDFLRVVQFHSYTARELIRNTANDKADYLEGLSQGVGVQQTKTVL